MKTFLFHNSQWMAFQAEILPVKPDKKNYPYILWSYEIDMQKYNQAIADLKAKALVVGNPELIGIFEGVEGMTIPDGAFYEWPAKAEINNGEVTLIL